jgi:alanine racemase
MGGDTATVFAESGLTPVLNTPGDIESWAAHGQAVGGARAILALDTGMQRLGLTPAEAKSVAGDPDALNGIALDYIMSHLACAEDASHPMNREQRILFDELRAALPATRASLANSGGIFLGQDFHYDLSRPGAALYGVSRSTGTPEPMKQVVGLKGKILQIRVVDSESTVGYGATHSVPAGSRLATVAAGYADGYLRSLGNRGHGYAAGVKVPVAGRVSMDLITFDISAVPPYAIGTGDDIDMICERHTIDDLAEEAGTIGYEILTALGQRYARTYIGGDVS